MYWKKCNVKTENLKALTKYMGIIQIPGFKSSLAQGSQSEPKELLIDLDGKFFLSYIDFLK